MVGRPATTTKTAEFAKPSSAPLGPAARKKAQTATQANESRARRASPLLAARATTTAATEPSTASDPHHRRPLRSARGTQSATFSPPRAAMNPAAGASTANPIASGPSAASAPAKPDCQSTRRSSVRNASRTSSEAVDIERILQDGPDPYERPAPRRSSNHPRLLSAATSSGASSTVTAATLLSRCATEPVPGMGSIAGERASNHARTTCLGVAP